MNFLDYTGLSLYDEKIKDYIDASDMRVSEMPTPTTELEGVIVQYVGVSNGDFIGGYFYKCNNSNWKQIDVQPGNPGGIANIWTGTHEEYEAQQNSIPVGTQINFTDDYDDNTAISNAKIDALFDI